MVSNNCDYLNNTRGRSYTLQEACELMEEMERNFTTGCSINWFDSKTGNPVCIGYTTKETGYINLTKKQKQKILDKKNELRSKENIKYMRRY